MGETEFVIQVITVQLTQAPKFLLHNGYPQTTNIFWMKLMKDEQRPRCPAFFPMWQKNLAAAGIH